MVTITKEPTDKALIIRIAGSIEESVNFDELIGSLPAELHVSCKEISRINSVGVKGWIKYFQGVQTKGIKLKFFECSTAIVEQINLISNFTCNGEIESIYAPFSCPSCKSELIGLFRTDQLKKDGLKLPELKCTKCNGQAVFDDIEEEYFGFLTR